MNAPVRRLSLVVAVLFASLLVSTTLIQYVFAADLNARPDNRRTLLSTFARERGEILVGQTAVAKSVPVDDEYKYQRVYDEGRLYAHVTGSYSFFGASGGLEQAENSLLSGSSDKLFYRRVSDLFTGRRAQGANVETTLDPKVQAAAADGLKGIKGAAVALDPKTGAILAMVSNPTYDPNDLASHDLTRGRQELQRAEQGPRQAAAQPHDQRAVPAGLGLQGRHGRGGAVDGRVHRELGAPRAGGARPARHLRRPAQPRRPRLLAERGGHDDRRRWRCRATRRSPTSGCRSAPTRCSRRPRSSASATPSRCRCGSPPAASPRELNKPQLAQTLDRPVRRAGHPAADGHGRRRGRQPRRRHEALPRGVGHRLRPVGHRVGRPAGALAGGDPRGRRAAHPDDGGRRRGRHRHQRAQIDGVAVAGKTGTAQHGEGRKAHAWFISFAPANDPKIAVAVIAEDGGVAGSEAGGGTVAAPIAKQMMEARLNR